MLSNLQKHLLDKAATEDITILLLIFAAAAMHGDNATVQYIVQRYAERFDAEEQANLREIAAIVAADTHAASEQKDTLEGHAKLLANACIEKMMMH